MEAAAFSHPKPTPSQVLLEHCFAFDTTAVRPTAAARLEELLGREFARRLVEALATTR